MENPYLRPLQAPQIIRAAFYLFKNNWITLVMISLVPHLVMLAITLGIPMPEKLEPGVIPKGLLISMLLHALLYAFTLTALTVAVTRLALGKKQLWAGAFGAAFKRPVLRVMMVYIMTMFLLAFLISPGLITGSFIAIIFGTIPALWLGGLFAPVVPILIIERRSAIQAWMRSGFLVRGDFIKCVIIFSFFIAVSTVVPFIVMMMQIGYAHTPLTPLLGAMVGSLTLPLGYTSLVLLYLSLRGAHQATPEQVLGELEGELPPSDIRGGPTQGTRPPANSGNGSEERHGE